MSLGFTFLWMCIRTLAGSYIPYILSFSLYHCFFFKVFYITENGFSKEGLSFLKMVNSFLLFEENENKSG